jgi:hypothetical protein
MWMQPHHSHPGTPLTPQTHNLIFHHTRKNEHEIKNLTEVSRWEVSKSLSFVSSIFWDSCATFGGCVEGGRCEVSFDSVGSWGRSAGEESGEELRARTSSVDIRTSPADTRLWMFGPVPRGRIIGAMARIARCGCTGACWGVPWKLLEARGKRLEGVATWWFCNKRKKTTDVKFNAK